ncbi:MAG: hypothetical protein WEC79_01680 [Thermomicrobiales bacterium]
MMFWILGYVALVVYAAGLFTWSVAHGRDGAAVGILLSISGLQLAIMETVAPGIAIAIAVAGLLAVGRDVAIAFRLGMPIAPALARLRGESAEEAA